MMTIGELYRAWDDARERSVSGFAWRVPYLSEAINYPGPGGEGPLEIPLREISWLRVWLAEDAGCECGDDVVVAVSLSPTTHEDLSATDMQFHHERAATLIGAVSPDLPVDVRAKSVSALENGPAPHESATDEAVVTELGGSESAVAVTASLPPTDGSSP